MTAKITWTKTDEAPALATYCLLPIIEAYSKGTGVEVELSDISLAGRVVANFPENLTDDQKIPDELTRLGEVALTEQGNIVKLPNISASIPQLQATIKELREKGYDIPEFPEEPKNAEEQALQDKFGVVLGSAVNPVLRQGNSDRRPAAAVKKFAQKNPHKMMKQWVKSGSKAEVRHMSGGDFFEHEVSTTVDSPTTVKITFTGEDGNTKTMKDGLDLLAGEVVDATYMSVKALRKFYEEEIDYAKKQGVLFSLHLKATMMKISDPIMFGHCVSVFYKDALDKHADALKEIGANVNNGIEDVYKKLDRLPADKKAEIEADLEKVYETRPDLAMVDSRYGITNLHVPNNIIVDASMPNVVRDGGRMWNKHDKLQDCIALVPDRCYATMYKVILEDAKAHGQFDPSTMGNVSNVGLMAQKAEEYGSHPMTFEAPSDGTFKIVDSDGNVLLERTCEKDDIFRMCQVKDAPIKDWVRLAVERAKDSGDPALFWLNDERAHDRELIKKIESYLPNHDTTGLDIRIKKPADAMAESCERARKGLNTISVTGNVLRDYLTDLFPILELGTSARVLSIVPQLAGGGLYETGAGGSAPKHVQQLQKEGHIRWDSLGEYCALVPSLEQIARNTNNPTAKLLADTLDTAIGMYLENARYPSRKKKEIDNRGSTFYLAQYWARALADQDTDALLKDRFTPVAKALEENEEKIFQELIDCQGEPVDLKGYYMLDDDHCTKVMRPSATFNEIIDALR